MVLGRVGSSGLACVCVCFRFVVVRVRGSSRVSLGAWLRASSRPVPCFALRAYIINIIINHPLALVITSRRPPKFAGAFRKARTRRGASGVVNSAIAGIGGLKNQGRLLESEF